MTSGAHVIVGSICNHITIGSVLAWGGTTPYIASYLKQFDDSVTIQDISNLYPILIIICFGCSSPGVKIAEKFGARTIIFTGQCVYLTAYFLMGWAKSVLAFQILYVIFFCVFSGILYMIPIKILWHYFPANLRGTVSGLIVGSYAFSGFIFTLLGKYIVNPNNLKPTLKYFENGRLNQYFAPEVANNVPMMLHVFLVIFVALSFFAIYLIEPKEDDDLMNGKVLRQKIDRPIPPPDNNLAIRLIKKPFEIMENIIEEYGGEADIGVEVDRKTPLELELKLLNTQYEVKMTDPQECQSFREAFFSLPFLLLCSVAILSAFNGQFMLNQYKNFGFTREALNDDKKLSTIGAMASACNGCSRIFWAIVFDKIGFKRVYYIVWTLQVRYIIKSPQIFTTATFLYSINSINIYGIYVCLSLFTMGGYFGTFPAQTNKIFGNKVGAVMYGLVFFSFSLTNLISLFLIQQQIEYEQCFLIAFGLTLIAGFLSYFFQDQYTWTQKEVSG